jgi:alginate O-acetyltransferase complex protein AlgI
MLFNSFEFLFVFLPLLLLAFYGFSRRGKIREARFILLTGSLFFYAYWDIRFLPLLLVSIAWNYLIGTRLIQEQREKTKKALLTLGIGADLLLLFLFKYSGFAVEILNGWFSLSLKQPHFTLPLGISFFTFTQIAYLVDTYSQKAEKSRWDSYALFVTIFPHLIAGPILHHKQMVQQFDNPSRFHWNPENFAQGLMIFAIGLCKKIFLADRLAHIAAPVFDGQWSAISFSDAWFGSLAYTLQLYFDFSGYSDMAIGLGLLFNLQLPVNFDSPYQSTSLIDFWKRWHMTLSQFLKDYLYIPLGGNRKGEWKKMRNLLITMILGGLWHGAGWTYLAWGALHGSLLAINHLWRRVGIVLPRLLSWLLTFNAVVIGWVFFRSPHLKRAVDILSAMADVRGFHFPHLKRTVLATGILHLDWLDSLLLISGLIIAFFLPNVREIRERWQPRFSFALGLGIAWAFAILFLQSPSEFLYYQF